MSALKKSFLGVAVSAALGCGSMAHAVVVDLFTDPVGSEQEVTTSTLNATVFDQAGPFPVGGVVGLYRDLSIKKTFDNVGSVNSGESRLAAGGGALTLENGSGIQSVGVVTWDGSNNAGAQGTAVDIDGFGGTGVDFTVGGIDRFLAKVLSADLGFDYKIRVWDMDGSEATLSASVQFQVTTPVDAHYLFSWFNLANGTYCDGSVVTPCADPSTQLDFSILRGGNFGLIDFAHIGAMQFELSNAGAVGVDLAIGSIQSVPEPGGLALVGIALLGAAVAGRQRSGSKAQ